MEIIWSFQKIEDLCKIIHYLRSNNLGEILESLGDYFIEKHSKNLTFENYTMDFSDSIDTSKISNAEYKLAYICELVNSHSKKRNKFVSLNGKYSKKIREEKDYHNVYVCLSFMIKYSINKKLKMENRKIDYKGFFLTSLIKEKIASNIIIKDKKDPFLDLLNISYFLTSELISECKDNENIVYKNTSLMSHCQNLDISIFTNKQIREICSILNTKRSLYARILLVLSYEILKMNNFLEPDWISKTVNFKNYEQFILLVTSPSTEVLLFLTSRKINKEY